MPRRVSEPFDRSLGQHVRFARRLAGMTQRQLAAAIGSRVSQVRRYEAGTTGISAARLLRIAVAVDAPLGWLYGLDDSDHWPDTLLAAVFHDRLVPGLLAAFDRITDDEARRRLLDMAERLASESRPRPPAPLQPPAAVPAPGERRRRALLVDNAPDLLAAVSACLRAGGYDVMRAHGAETALDILCRDEPLDVLVADDAPPGLNGMELVRRAAGLRPGLAALVITAFTEAPDLAGGRQAGMVVLAKPFARADLLGAVQALRACVEGGTPDGQ